MQSAVAILTYQRQDVLKKMLDSLVKNLPKSMPVAIFDDASRRDNTANWLRTSSTQPVVECGFVNLLETIECDGFTIFYKDRPIEVYIGRNNVGVAGNSNRAIKWFEMATIGFDHLFLCNDDLVFYTDAVAEYAKAHTVLEVGLFCLNNLRDDSHRWMTVNARGYKVKVFRKMTGAVMSMTKPVIDAIGYFDPAFGRFGEEHCDYTNRARLKGFINVLGKAQSCIDIEWPKPTIDHQHEAESSVFGLERDGCDAQAMKVMDQKINEYRAGIFKHPFKLRHVPFVGGHAGFDSGIKPKNMPGYTESPPLIKPFD